MARSIALRVFRDDELVETRVFERNMIKVGRLASAHLRLSDPQVSRMHAIIDVSAQGDQVSIIDMSATGTRVNGERVSRARLRHGDQIALGNSRLEIVLEASELEKLRGSPDGEGIAPQLTHDAPTLPPESAQVVADTETEMVEAGELQRELQAAAAGGADDDDVFGPPPASTPAKRVDASSLLPPAAPARPSAATPRRSPPLAAGAPLMPVPEDPIRPDNRHVEVALRWGGSVVELKRVGAAARFTIGTAEKADLFVPLEGIGASPRLFELLRPSGTTGLWQVRFTPEMAGQVRVRGMVTPLSTSGGVPDADGAVSLTLTDEMQVELHLGQVTLEIRCVSRSKVIPLPPLVDTLFINTALVSLASFFSLVAVLAFSVPSIDEDDDSLLTNPARFQTLILKPPPKDDTFLAKLRQKSAARQAAKEKAGKAGGKKEKKTEPARMSSPSPAPKKPTDEQVVAAQFNKLFGADGNAGMAQIFGADLGGGELQSLLGGLQGANAGNSAGAGGLSLRGSGPGGGGTGTATLGVGPIGTLGRGSGDASYGASEGGIGAKTDRDPVVTQGTPEIFGSLDKEIIRRVVRENMAQVRYCYERELTRTPGLFGKVTMKWTISDQGKVITASVLETQMKNAAVEQCLARRIQGWRFPKPKGGGTVVVTYPFVFKKSG